MPKWTIFLISSKVSNSQSKELVLITEILWRIFWRNKWRSLIVVVENFSFWVGTWDVHNILYQMCFRWGRRTITRSDYSCNVPNQNIFDWTQAVGALGELWRDFSLHAWDSFSQEIRDLLLIFYCQKSLNLHEVQWFSS